MAFMAQPNASRQSTSPGERTEMTVYCTVLVLSYASLPARDHQSCGVIGPIGFKCNIAIAS